MKKNTFIICSLPEVYRRVVHLVNLDINGAASSVVEADVERRVDHVAHINCHTAVRGDVQRDVH